MTRDVLLLDLLHRRLALISIPGFFRLSLIDSYAYFCRLMDNCSFFNLERMSLSTANYRDYGDVYPC